MSGVIERYYEQKFYTDILGRPQEDQYVNQHTNGLCLIGIAPTHPIVTKGIKISSINFNVDKDLLNNKVSGKYKKGARLLQESTPLCAVHLEDGSEYIVFSCVNGNLLELNDNLIVNPQLLVTKASTEGFIAIITPKEDFDFSHLKSIEEYCQERGLATPERKGCNQPHVVYDMDI